MSRNKSCDLRTALDFCILAILNKDSAGLFYYHVACITDNAIAECKGSYVTALKDLNAEEKNQLAFAYFYLAINLKIVDKLRHQQIINTNPATYFFAAVKLGFKPGSDNVEIFKALADQSYEYYQSEEYYQSAEYLQSSRSNPNSKRPKKHEELEALLEKVELPQGPHLSL